MDEAIFQSAEDGCSVNTPLTDVQRNIVIVTHYMTFVVVTGAIYVFLKKYEVLQTRIWSPFLLLLALTFNEIGPAFEIGNHFYVNNWELLNPESDLINASFFFLNFAAQNLLALSLRKKGLPLVRPIECSFPDGIIDAIAMLGDFLFIILVPITPLVYIFFGRGTATSTLSPLAAVSSIWSLLRAWKNFGPNKYTKWGSIAYFVLAMLGVVMLAVYKSTCIEFVHVAIGGSFVSSLIPFSIALLNAEYSSTPGDVEQGANENTPLVN